MGNRERGRREQLNFQCVGTACSREIVYAFQSHPKALSRLLTVMLGNTDID